MLLPRAYYELLLHLEEIHSDMTTTGLNSAVYNATENMQLVWTASQSEGSPLPSICLGLQLLSVFQETSRECGEAAVADLGYKRHGNISLLTG